MKTWFLYFPNLSRLHFCQLFLLLFTWKGLTLTLHFALAWTHVGSEMKEGAPNKTWDCAYVTLFVAAPKQRHKSVWKKINFQTQGIRCFCKCLQICRAIHSQTTALKAIDGEKLVEEMASWKSGHYCKSNWTINPIYPISKSHLIVNLTIFAHFQIENYKDADSHINDKYLPSHLWLSFCFALGIFSDPK